MNRFNVHAKPFISRCILKYEDSEEQSPRSTPLKVRLTNSKIMKEQDTQTEPEFVSVIMKNQYYDSYPIPKGYNAEEATLWKKIRPSAKLAKIDDTLCVGEPEDLTFVRTNMLQYKFKLIKEKSTDNTYYIKSVITPDTHPSFMDFMIYYRNDNQMPYKTDIRLKTMTKIQEYDVIHNCRLMSKITIPKGKKKIYKQTFDYVKKQKLLEVTHSETHEVLHTDILTGECWLENHFNYRD